MDEEGPFVSAPPWGSLLPSRVQGHSEGEGVQGACRLNLEPLQTQPGERYKWCTSSCQDLCYAIPCLAPYPKSPEHKTRDQLNNLRMMEGGAGSSKWLRNSLASRLRSGTGLLPACPAHLAQASARHRPYTSRQDVTGPVEHGWKGGHLQDEFMNGKEV